MNNPYAIVALIVFLGGCAAGNRYDYVSASMALPVRGSGELGVAVIDLRPYVLNGDKQPDFVGLQRGGYGNPFDVTTQSGKPLAVDLQIVLVRALEESGYTARPMSLTNTDATSVAQAMGKELNVILFLNEWKTDAMMKFGVTYDIELKVINGDAQVIAQARSSAIKEVAGGAGFEGQNSRLAAQIFETKVSRLFNVPEVKNALTGW